MEAGPQTDLFVIRCDNAGKSLALKELKGSTAAGGDVAHLVMEAHLVCCSCAVAAADDGGCIGVSHSLCDCLCALGKDRVLEDAHRSVPDNSLGGLDGICEELDGLGADIHAHLVGRDLVDINSLNSDLGIDGVRELGSDDSVNGKKQALAELFCLLDHVCAVVNLGLVYERLADLIAFCLCEGVGHAAADDEGVALLKQVVDNSELVRNLCAAQNSYERTYRILNCLAEEVDFLLHQVTDNAGIDVLCNTDVGAVCAVCSTESVVYEDISQGSELFGELLAVLGLFLAITGVLKKNNIAVLHSCNSCLGVLADYVVIFCEDNFLAERHSERRFATGARDISGLGSPFGLPRWEQRITLPPSAMSFLMVGSAATDTVVVSDHASLERKVEVEAAQYALALHIDIVNRFFIKSHFFPPNHHYDGDQTTGRAGRRAENPYTDSVIIKGSGP